MALFDGAVPIDVGRWRSMVAVEGARPLMEWADGKPTDRQRLTREGLPLFEVPVTVTAEGRRAETIGVQVAGDPGLADADLPARVHVEELTVRVSERNGRASMTWSAQRVVPAVPVPPARASRPPSGGGGG